MHPLSTGVLHPASSPTHRGPCSRNRDTLGQIPYLELWGDVEITNYYPLSRGAVLLQGASRLQLLFITSNYKLDIVTLSQPFAHGSLAPFTQCPLLTLNCPLHPALALPTRRIRQLSPRSHIPGDRGSLFQPFSPAIGLQSDI